MWARLWRTGRRNRLKAYVITVQIVVDPRVVDPGSQNGTGAVADWTSELLSYNEQVFDWAYSIVTDSPEAPVEVIDLGDLDDYEEGEFIALLAK
jgi:hypothetical protein